MRPLLTTLTLVLLCSGCKNPCQRVCDRMARYAEEECGLTVSWQQLDCCYQAQAGAGSRGDRATCRQLGSLSDIESTWSCNDLLDYGPFDGEACDGDAQQADSGLE